MKILVEVLDGGQLNNAGEWSARCEFAGFRLEQVANDRGEAIASVRRAAFAHLAQLEQPPRYVEFEVVAQGMVG